MTGANTAKVALLASNKQLTAASISVCHLGNRNDTGKADTIMRKPPVAIRIAAGMKPLKETESENPKRMKPLVVKTPDRMQVDLTP